MADLAEPDAAGPARQATMDDVAAEASVSRATVSRVLSRAAKVQPGTRQRVLTAINRLGYVPNRLAQTLATRSSPVVGLLLRDPRTPVYGLLHAELQDRAAQLGIEMVTVTPPSAAGAGSEQRALHTLLGLRVGGLLIATGVSHATDLAPFLGVVPVVAVGRPEDDPAIHAVCYDEPANGRRVADAVLAHGHRTVAVLVPDRSVSLSEFQRATAMVETLTRGGAQVRQVTAHQLAVADEGCVEMVELVRHRRVTAALFPSDERALHFMARCDAAGIAIPGEVSVTGVDGAGTALDQIGLATVRLPVATVAGQAVVLLAELLGGPATAVRHSRHPGEFRAGRTLDDAPVRHPR